jgi:hypothetical protein
VQTAIEAYTPMYALFCRARISCAPPNSLQLDEVVAIYIAKILGTDYHLAFMKNGHPLVPLSTLQAGYRLMMHGLDVEACTAGCVCSSAGRRRGFRSTRATRRQRALRSRSAAAGPVPSCGLPTASRCHKSAGRRDALALVTNDHPPAA